MKILVIAPHADDEVLGAGATIAKYIKSGHQVYVCISTKGVMPLFDDETAKRARREILAAHSLLGISHTYFLDLPAAMLESIPRHDINGKILNVVNEVKPDIVFIPHFGDMQKDHAIIADASMVALRPKYGHRVNEIYAYETLSETEWNVPHSSNMFVPNTYIDVSGYLEKKLEAMRCYESQLSDFPNPRSLDAITALARYRGSTINTEAAEAFMLIRRIF